MDPEANRYVDLSPYWEVEDEEYDYCDCPGPPPPPQFVIPPPPPPPSLQLCRGEHSDLQYCEAKALGAEYTHPHFHSLPVIAVVSSVVLVAILVASFLLWKHKKKVQNFLPCKSDHQNTCDIGSSNGVTYDDVLINHHPTRLPNHHGNDTQTLTPIELLDIKFGRYGDQHMAPVSHTNFSFTGKEAGSLRSNKSKEQFNPVYEEVSGNSDGKGGSRSCDSDIDDSEVEARTVASEDEFAEDELSLGEYPHQPSRPCSGTSSLLGSTGGDLCPDVGSASSDGAGSTENKELQRLFRRNRHDGSSGRKHSSHSLERNKNGHPSEGFEAKQNYYKGKNMLGPDLAYPDTKRDSGTGIGLTPRQFVGHHNPSRQCLPWKNITFPRGTTNQGEGRIPGLYFTGAGSPAQIRPQSPPPPPYPTELGTESLPSVYNPHTALPATTTRPGRLPENLLSELNERTCKAKQPVNHSEVHSHSGHVFTVGPEDAYPLADGYGNQGATVPLEFRTFHPSSRKRPPTPPIRGNVYSSVEDEGLFTIDGSRHRGNPTSRVPSDPRQSFAKTDKRTVPKNSSKCHNIPVSQNVDENGPYGDIQPVFDSRTLCT
ncbi:uncharacterized protein LOC106465109 isoform X2 [Limulus polyphemus]|nr:uncharacterized protein LOC106465109 isoform X2 [Limulus polyphemus]XP_022249136.1 uncharacterized protein LOC106465109 isoform X2 [Limulus polyphemus]